MGPIQRRDEHLVRRVSTVHLYAAFLAAIVVGVVPVGIVLPGERSNGEAQLSVKGGPNMPMNDATSQSTSTPSMRLIFEYEGDQVRLISQQAVDVAITGFDISRAAHPGYYVDTQDSDGRTLARVSARDAFSRSTEVFPEQPGQPITRVDVEGARGAFTVVVPGRLSPCRCCAGTTGQT